MEIAFYSNLQIDYVDVATETSSLNSTSPFKFAEDGWLADDATWILCAAFIIFTMQTGRDVADVER